MILCVCLSHSPHQFQLTHSHITLAQVGLNITNAPASHGGTCSCTCLCTTRHLSSSSHTPTCGTQKSALTLMCAHPPQTWSLGMQATHSFALLLPSLPHLFSHTLHHTHHTTHTYGTPHIDHTCYMHNKCHTYRITHKHT